MCGIGGIVVPMGETIREDRLRAMIELVRHRGPDGGGVCCEGNVGIAHRRLRVIDISEAADQPMHSGDGRYSIVYNGEIYNYVELRQELERLGCRFRTNSDTEVILQSFATWGRDCMTRFNGMWAFALLDRIAGELVCSRDRFGIKPFYYVNGHGLFAFGSEIRQLVALCPNATADADVLADFLLTGIADHSEKTFFKDIFRLSGGHNLVYRIAEGQASITPYYHLVRREELSGYDCAEAIERYRSVLDSSVTLRLRSDVRVGTCLSGGVDSSSIALLAGSKYRQKTGQPFAAITAVSTQEDNDESRYAQEVARCGGLEWLSVRPTYEDFRGAIDAVTECQEEPYGGPSVIMQYFVMRTAREHGITVLLDGQGGDEMLLGYPKYYAAYLLDELRHGRAAGALGLARRILRNDENMTWARLGMYLLAGHWAGLRYRFYRRRHAYLKSEFARMPAHLGAFSRSCADPFELQSLEIRSTNLPILLRYEDKNSMAHAVEARLPFVDYRAVETALSLPDQFKIRDGWTKWLLRQAMSDVLPPSIAWRRDKRGFEAPERQWLRAHQPHMSEAIRSSSLLAQLCDSKKLSRLYSGLDARSRWRLYSVALWEQKFSVLF